MAREFGKRSYNPEQIRYLNVCNRPGKMGQPWVLMDPKLHQNIFLACYDNPMNAEDLAIEVGVALPYMEDILERLSAQTLLIKEKNKYETAFPILSRGALKKIHVYYADALPRLTARLEEYIDGLTALFQEAGLCYYGDYQSYDEAKWMLLLNSYKELYRVCENSPQRTLGRTERPDFGQWDVVGFEKTDFSPKMVGFHCQLNHFVHYRFEYADICSRTPANLSGEETALLLRMVEGKKITDPADLTIADRLVEYGYAVKEGDGYRPRVALLSGKTNRAFEQFCAKKKRGPEFIEQLNGIKELVDAIFAEIVENNRAIREILVADLPARIRRANTVDPLLESIFADSLTLGYLVEQAIADGWLKYDDSTSPAVGAYFNLQ